MSEPQQAAAAASQGGHGGGHDDAHSHFNPAHYWKIAKLLMVLAAISYVGPFIGDRFGLHWLTLISAFGIALYKAYLVCVNFMHLHVERRFVVYILSTALAFMFLFYAGASPDVRQHRGRQWENVSAQYETERALAEHAHGGGHGEHGDEGAHGEHGDEGSHGEH